MASEHGDITEVVPEAKDDHDGQSGELPEKRFRTLTVKGKEQYDSIVQSYKAKLSKTCNEIHDSIVNSATCENDITVLQNVYKKLNGDFKRYSVDHYKFCTFLNGTRTEDSAHELEVQGGIFMTTQSKVESVCTKLDHTVQVLKEETKSHHPSIGSRHSVKSVKVETAKAKLRFAEQEAALTRKRAELEQEEKIRAAENERRKKELETEIGLLKLKEEVECDLLKAEEDNGNLPDDTQLPVEDTYDRTKSYVDGLLSTPVYNRPPENEFQPSFWHPSGHLPPVHFGQHNYGSLRNTETDLAKFLMKKDLLTSRLHKFDDRPENYVSWKETFKCVIQDIGASPMEELDLLLKWTGFESSKQVISIKASNAGNPRLGLVRAWERLDLRYGSPEKVEQALKRKLDAFPKITYKDKAKMYDLSDILAEISAIKGKPYYTTLFSYYDSSVGVNPIVAKLPLQLQNKWRDRATSYKRTHHVIFPPFSFFAQFIREMAELINDPSFEFDFRAEQKSNTPRQNSGARTQQVNTAKSTVTPDKKLTRCLIHKLDHSLDNCVLFRRKTFDQKKAFLKQHGVCFKCCANQHLKEDCRVDVTCDVCKSKQHVTVMHNPKWKPKISAERSENHGGEPKSAGRQIESRCTDARQEDVEPKVVDIAVESRCTEVCEEGTGKSCAKIVLVDVFHESRPNIKLRIYAIIDEQSNYSLVHGDLLDEFDVTGTPCRYSLNSCNGTATMTGRRAKGFFVQSIDGREQLTLPTLTECQFIPNNRKEIPTQNVAQNYSHLKPIAEHIPPIDDNAHILLLIGRDLSAALHIEDQRIGLPYQPFAQKLKLGWVIIGESCLDGSHIPSTVNTMKTYVQSNGRTSFLEPCSSHFHVSFTNTEKSLFQVTKQDNKIGMSYEDKQFMHIMEDEMHLDDDNHWVAPLPFKQQRPSLPNNRTQALKRAKIFDSSIQKDSVKRQHVLEFMQKLLDNGHAERAPEIEPSSECWFLPLFGVYHPRKRDHIRIVFDSSARYQGVSLNDVLMSGPNLVNSLLGVLMRFRCGNVAIIADIQQMFYCFYVEPEHRDYLRFIWHEDNDLTKPLVDYRMKVHVFGNSPSPAIATFGLRKAADIAGETSGKDVKDYIYRNFYVDDALSSHDTSAEAIDLLSRTRSALQDNGSLRLHKICSNSSDVLVAFDPDDLAKDLKDLNLDSDNPPLQRSLGVSWDLRLDAFTFNVSQEEMPFTRRGILSIVNGIYDPLGFAAPVTIHGKLILREVDTSEWDLPVHENIRRKFQIWKEGLNELRNVHISRPLTGTGSDESKNLVIFSDASESAVAAVAFIHTRCGQSEQYRFVMGKSKVAPKNGHTIPRLELCAAVLAVDLYETIRDELNTTFENITFYTDSKVVLGYIHNETKRFYIYVRNRVDRIRQSTVPAQWRYVPSSKNPADEATRPFTSEHLQNSQWLNGPRNFYQEIVSEPLSSFPLVSPDLDSEIRSLKTTLVSKDIFGSERFEKYSSWTSLVNAITFLRKVAKRHKSDPEIASPQNSEEFIIKVVQREAFAEEIIALQENRKLPRDSKILKLSPYLDSTGLLRVGGRISNANISSEEANPVIIPNHHIATLICRHYHAKVYHQGRTLTEGSIRNAGYWLIGGKRIVSSSIYKCVRCRRLRGRQTDQRMADLPFERLDPAPPFTYIGIDVFGPWTVSARKTRGGQVNSKRWGLIFTCMVVRAVHIEVLDEMSSSCFINALRRFCALRGEVKVIHSDRGTNFIGSTKDLNANVINIEDRPVKSYLTEHGINWVFNPPHSSHMGGVWERMIGVARRILDSILLDVKHLTHDVITTLMAEVTSIINARPLTPLTTDPEVPFPLTPSTLLNMKSDQSVKCFRIQDFNPRDLYTHQWRRVQHLANQFWSRWKREYLPTLQFREKWQQDCTNLKEGDIVVLRDNSEHRNDWPIGIIVKAYESADNRVRKVDVRLGRDRKIYTRPVKEVILLLSE